MAELRRDIDDQQRSAAFACNSLGNPMRIFKTSALKHLVVAACGAAMVGCGLLVLFYPIHRGYSFFPPSMVGAGGLVLVLDLYFLKNQRLLVCPGGIQRISGRIQEQFRWDELCEITAIQVKRGLVTSRRCALVGKDGSRIVLTDLAIAQYDEMIVMLRQLADTHVIPWKEEQEVK